MRQHHRGIVVVLSALVGLAGSVPAQAFVHDRVKETLENLDQNIQDLGRQVIPDRGASSGESPSQSGTVIWNEPGKAGADSYFRSAFNGALENARAGTATPWRNPNTGERGVITPVATFNDAGGTPCRNYRWTLVSGAKSRLFEGTACRVGASNWQVRQETEQQSTVANAGNGDTPWLSGQGTTVQQPSIAAPQSNANRDKQMVADAQRMLNQLGYNAGDIDGLYGKQTRGAITAFQQDRGLPAAGDVTPQLMARLSQETPGQGGLVNPQIAQAPQGGVTAPPPGGRVFAPAPSAPIGTPAGPPWQDVQDFAGAPTGSVVVVTNAADPEQYVVVGQPNLSPQQRSQLEAYFPLGEMHDHIAGLASTETYSVLRSGIAGVDTIVVSVERYEAVKLADVTRRIFVLPGGAAAAQPTFSASPVAAAIAQPSGGGVFAPAPAVPSWQDSRDFVGAPPGSIIVVTKAVDPVGFVVAEETSLTPQQRNQLETIFPLGEAAFSPLPGLELSAGIKRGVMDTVAVSVEQYEALELANVARRVLVLSGGTSALQPSGVSRPSTAAIAPPPGRGVFTQAPGRRLIAQPPRGRVFTQQSVGDSVAQAGGQPLAAPATPQSPSAGDVFNVDFLAPEGIRMGMSVQEARAALEGRGYRLRDVGVCDFELQGSSSKGNTGVVLNIRGGSVPLGQCPNDRSMVVGVSYKQTGDQAPAPIKPDTELRQIVQRIGKQNTCPAEKSYSVDCVWTNVASEPAIGQLRIQINTAGYRNITITANLAEVLPAIGSRQQNVQSMEMEALQICRYYKGGGADNFRRLNDCNAVAKKMGQAYVKGLIDKPTPFNMSAYASPVAANPELSSASAVPPQQAPTYTSFFEVPSGIRPLKLWLKDDRPVLRKEFNTVTTMDETFDRYAQEEELSRFVNLMLLASAPTLIGDKDADRVLAGQNLAEADRDRLMKGCSPPYGSYCSWGGEDVFERRTNIEEFQSRFAPLLNQIKIDLPQEIIFVEQVELGKYSAEKGGFPISWVGQNYNNFMISKGVGGRPFTGAIGRPVEFTRNISLLPEIWRLNPSRAEAVLNRMSGGRRVQLAWTYRITDVVDAQKGEYIVNRYVLRAETVSASLYLDFRLTDLLGDLPIGGKAVASTDSIVSATPAADVSYPKVVFRKPGPLDRIPIFWPEPNNPNANSGIGFANLLALGENPELIDDPKIAKIIAHQNLVGLTNNTAEWSGTNEFELARSEAAFNEVYKNQIIEMAPRLPQDIRIRTAVQLAPYDFDRQGFVISWGKYTKQDDLFTLFRLSNEAAPSTPMAVIWNNGSLPEFWPMEPNEAQNLVQYMKEQNAWSGATGVITTGVEIGARLVDITKGANGSLTFGGKILEIGVYSNRGYAREIANWGALVATPKPQPIGGSPGKTDRSSLSPAEAIDPLADEPPERLEFQGVRLGMALREARQVLEQIGYELSSRDWQRLERKEIGASGNLTYRGPRTNIELRYGDKDPLFGPSQKGATEADSMGPYVTFLETLVMYRSGVSKGDAYQPFLERFKEPTECGGSGPNDQNRPFDCTWVRDFNDRKETLKIGFGQGGYVLELTAKKQDSTLALADGIQRNASASSLGQSPEPAEETKIAAALLYPGNARFAVEDIRAGMTVGEAKAVLLEQGFTTYNYLPCVFSRQRGGAERIVTIMDKTVACKDVDIPLYRAKLVEKYDAGTGDASAQMDAYRARLGPESRCGGSNKLFASCIWKNVSNAPHVESFSVRIVTNKGERTEDLTLVQGHAEKWQKPAFVEAQNPTVLVASAQRKLQDSTQILANLLQVVGKPYGEALGLLQSQGYALTDALGCRFNGKFKADEPPSDIDISGLLNHKIERGQIKADAGNCERPVSAFNFSQKTRFADLKTNYDTTKDMEIFVQALGQPNKCNLNTVLSSCQWTDSAALPGSAVWVKSTIWPRGVNRSIRLQPISQ